jgi:hypothetical protein
MKNVSKRTKIILGAVVIVVIIVAGVFVLATTGMMDLPLFGTSYSFTVSPTSITNLAVGSTVGLTVTPYDSIYMRFTSDNSAIATIDYHGVVKGILPGTTNVRVRYCRLDAADGCAYTIRSVPVPVAVVAP